MNAAPASDDMKSRQLRAKRRIPLSPARHTRFVGISKLVLWGIALTLLVGIIFTAWSGSDVSGMRVVFSEAATSGGDGSAPRMLKPRYQGVDAQNRPYTVIAETATQQSANSVRLEDLSADMMLESAAWLALTADSGLMDTQKKTLELNDNIHLFYEGGYEFRSTHAFVDLKAGTTTGDVPIEGQGPAGTLKARRYAIFDKGKRLVFNDSVTVRLYP